MSENTNYRAKASRAVQTLKLFLLVATLAFAGLSTNMWIQAPHFPSVGAAVNSAEAALVMIIFYGLVPIALVTAFIIYRER